MGSRGRAAALALSCFQGEVSRPLRIPPQMDLLELWGLSGKSLSAALRLRPSERSRLASFKSGFSAGAVFSELKRRDIGFVALGDDGYPAGLAQIYDPPPGLFLYGAACNRLEEFMSCPRIAIVGARAASRYGIDAATRLAESLSREAVCIVSGMALGIDSAAHRGALGGTGASVAVLGCGVDVIYPRFNRSLYSDLLKAGLVVSEYPPGVQPRAWRFPARNRIIAGLSDGVIVVEARGKSGALITADFSLEQGRQVYAVPGSIFSDLSSGPNALIKTGAAPVTGAEDVLEDLGLKVKAAPKSDKQGPVQPPDLTDDERRVFLALDGTFRHEDGLAAMAGVDSSRAAAALVSLELRGLARYDSGRGYSR